MKVFKKDGTELKDVIVEYDEAGNPAFIRHKNNDTDPQRIPASEFKIEGTHADEKRTNDKVVEK